MSANLFDLTGKVAIAAVCFGLTSVLFAQLTHGIAWTFKRTIAIPWLRPAIGETTGQQMQIKSLARVGHEPAQLGKIAVIHRAGLRRGATAPS